MKYSEAVSLFVDMRSLELREAAMDGDKPYVTLLWNDFLDMLEDVYDVPYEVSRDWLPPSMAPLSNLIVQGEL